MATGTSVDQSKGMNDADCYYSFRFKPWASNGKSLRVGEIILIIDADTIVPVDCFRDAAREMAASEELAIIQHESGMSILMERLILDLICYLDIF